jgi:hypothetical protein
MNVQFLIERGACYSAVEWAAEQKNKEDAWQNCQRGDWMIWYVSRMCCKNIDSKISRKLMLAICDCLLLKSKHREPLNRDQLRLVRLMKAWANKELPTDNLTQEILSRFDGIPQYLYGFYAYFHPLDFLMKYKHMLRRMKRYAKVVRQHFPNCPRMKGGAK